MGYESRYMDHVKKIDQSPKEAIAFCCACCNEDGLHSYNVTLRCYDSFKSLGTGEVEYEPTAEWSRIQQALKELEELKSRLPVNADGDVPTIDDHQFMIDDEDEVVEFIVDMMHKESGEIYLHGHTVGEKFGVVTPLISQCHSTAESCRAANGGGE